MCMQNFITIFFTVLEIGPFSLFQNLELVKASTDKKCQFTISWARSYQYQCLRKCLLKYSTQFKRPGHFHLFKIWHSAKTRPIINVTGQFLWLDLFNTLLSTKFCQNIPNGLRVNFHFFQNLNLGKTSTNPKCHLTISWATTCQYTNVMKNDISQSLGLDLDNINVYAEVYQNIPLSSRDKVIFTFFQNLALGKASTDDKCHFAIVSRF